MLQLAAASALEKLKNLTVFKATLVLSGTGIGRNFFL
jgi:hypothetical protein